MSKKIVFILGHEGTTGLRIHVRLSGRGDINLLSIADEDRTEAVLSRLKKKHDA